MSVVVVVGSLEEVENRLFERGVPGVQVAQIKLGKVLPVREGKRKSWSRVQIPPGTLEAPLEEVGESRAILT